MEEQCPACKATKPEPTKDIYLISRVAIIDGKFQSVQDKKVTGPQLAGRVCRYCSPEKRHLCINQGVEPDYRCSYRPPPNMPDMKYFEKMASEILASIPRH